MTRELILYALPTGPLAEAVARSFTGLATTAQAYPPHVSLTGFFHHVGSVEGYVEALDECVGPTAVDVVELRTSGGWVGLVLDSPDLRSVTGRFVAAAAAVEGRTDAFREKTWLHLSIAYGHEPVAHARLAAHARRTVDPTLAVGWDVALLERAGGHWTTHGRRSLPSLS